MHTDMDSQELLDTLYFVKIAQQEAEISLKMLKKTPTRQGQLQKAFSVRIWPLMVLAQR